MNLFFLLFFQKAKMKDIDSRLKLFLGMILLCSFIVIHVHFVYNDCTIKPYVEPQGWSRHLPMHLDLDNLTEKGTKEKIIALAKVIYSAKKHVRGSKTSYYLNKAISIMNNILEDIKVDSKNVYERQSVKSKHICEESYKGGLHGYPMYYEGFVTDNCSYGVPVSKLVTVIKYIANTSGNESLLADFIDNFIISVDSVMKDANILIAVNTESFPNNLVNNYRGVKINSSKYQSEGSALNSLIKDVKTSYVLVARKMNTFTNDSRLERLVREIESINVTAVGGAFRESNGHWRKGCFQSVYRNYTLKYMEGYDESFHECLFCDYIQGPFITTTKYLMENKFKSLEESNGLYEDWFLRIAKSDRETIVCPDSMFHIDSKSTKSSSNWTEFSEYWNVFKVITPNGQTINRSCENVEITIEPTKALSPCALKLYSDGIKLIMQMCEKSGTICEFEEGTGLGAVKLGKNLPWDIDYDLRFSLKNCSSCQQLEMAFKNFPIKTGKFSPKCCEIIHEPIFFEIYYKGQYGDFAGHPELDSEKLVKSGIPPTKVLFTGQWSNAPRNPGLAFRNRYGRELYRHANHWRHTGQKDHRPKYTTNVFMPCKSPGAHNCLDRYNGDGNIQFKMLLP
ncbi:uncharacterized protein LOC132737585 [Ruditapes philippinarum]|uniref:uncharacterized protein LOC132737585 n=1 Tax=Ruditapes philippinarum TaxID=129788 RepID=UPI00295A6911|nr:uncharacterized protein LOC132737585 [Ruditapes philippinarum]